MEKGFNSWSQDHQIDWQSLNPNLTSPQFGLGPRVMFPSFGNVISPPVIHEPCGWFYGLPRHRQGFGLAPMVNSMANEVKETLPEASPVVAPETKGGQKKFLVFDQSGDQTTLMYGFGVGPSSTRYQFPSLNKPKPQHVSHTVCVDKLFEENNRSYSESEMREDTEELNALLYSDDDDDDEDDDDDDDEDEDEDDDDEDDETSTGHSPNSMTGFQGQKREFESVEDEEVASSGGPWKRCKKEDASNFVNSPEDTASSGKSGINCSANDVFEEEYDNFSSGNKKIRIEKIKETINLLQNLIPGDTKGKNAIMVIDEAIHYLTSLKVKAKALELDSF